MAKAKNNLVFFCKECGYESGKWMGQCPACKAWNSFVEEPVVSDKKSQAADKIRIPGRGAAPVRISEISIEDQDRTTTGFGELDRAEIRESENPRCSCRCAEIWPILRKKYYISPVRNL